MSVLAWNAEGLKNCFEDEDFLNLVNNFDLIFFSETWQRKYDNFQLDGYECIAVPRSESMKEKSKRGHGGICLFIKNSLKRGVELLETNKAGFIWIKLCQTYFSLNEDIYICFTYIPPKESKYYKMQDIDYFEMLEAGVRKYSNVGKVSVIGDLNARTGSTDAFIHNLYFS